MRNFAICFSVYSSASAWIQVIFTWADVPGDFDYSIWIHKYRESQKTILARFLTLRPALLPTEHSLAYRGEIFASC